MKKIIDQWYMCAKRSQSDNNRTFYKNVLVNMANEGKHLWGEYSYGIRVDDTLETFPKVIHSEEEEQYLEKIKQNKRKADAQNGPAVNTPISTLRKKKGRKPGRDTDDMDDDEESEGAMDSDTDDESSTVQATNSTKEKTSRETKLLGAASANVQPREDDRLAPKPPAGAAKYKSIKKTQREGSAITARQKENISP